ncbi:MAG: tetratricopeptide repeat protein [Bacteroidota bacterium]
MHIKKLFFPIILLWMPILLSAQATTLYTDANLAYKRGTEFYKNGNFALAQQSFEKAMQLYPPNNEPELELLRTQAQLYYAKCAVRLNLPDGEKLILDFAREHDPDPIANQAVLEMANYYYNAKEYEKASQLFAQIDAYDLNREQRSEVKFKQGYSLFVKRKFKEAKGHFEEVKDVENEYYFPTNYYLGLCHFFENKYNQAIASFKRVERSKKYKPHIPYYITQIYFAQGNYEDAIAYGRPKLEDKSVRKRAEISLLVGQAYFEKGEFARALPFLEAAAKNSSKLRKEDFFQLGFVQYETGKYKEAIENFEQLSRLKSELGQNAMYLLGDCHIKTDNNAAARNAFKAASRMDYDSSIKEEALYNYAKLSYELNYDREAVDALQQIDPSSKYYAEAQTILSAIFLNTRDYAKALQILEQIPSKTPKMRETYQKVAYYRGVQLYQAGNTGQARQLFEKSIAEGVDARTKALATYWLGEMAHQDKEYATSIRELNKFTALAKTMSRLPDESSLYTANYTQGYNYLKQENYESALGFFQDAIAGIRQNSMYINNEYVRHNILGDATLRAGDCLFKRNQYTKAVRFYDDAINNQYSGYVYALYQKAIIEGLRGKTTNKIIALESLVDDHPRSAYADNALLQLGVTYLEIGKFDQATKPLKRLINEFKSKSELLNQALLKLGLISYNQGNLPTAINYYKQVFSNNPDPKEAQAALSALEEIYVDDLGKSDEYFAFLETIPGYSVGNDEKEAISFKAAESQFESGNYEKAINGYNNYIRKYPNGRYGIIAYYHRGESYAVLQQYGNAFQDYSYIVGKGQSKYYLKALKKAALISYNYQQDFNKAYQLYTQLEEAASDEDTRFEAQLGAMRSAYRINDTQAVRAMATKVANNPRATDDQKASANFYIGKLAFDSKEYDKALQAFNEVTKLSDNEQTAEARYQIAYIYYLRRDLDVAQQLCLNANKESSNYPYWIAKSVILLADILAEKGDLFNAQAALEGLIENYDEDQELVNIAKAKLEKIKSQQAASSRLRVEPENSNFLEMDPDEGGN